MGKLNYVWMFNPNSGGVKIPIRDQKQIHDSIVNYITALAPEVKLDIRFRSQFCYIGSIEDNVVMPVCRMRHFKLDNWSVALYSYGSDKYEACNLESGKWDGKLEEVLKISHLYLIN